MTATLSGADAISVSNLPPGLQAYFGYVNGNWPTWSGVQARFPNAHLFSIAVNASVDADFLDVEKGDATIAQAPAWVKRRLSEGAWRPGIYTSVANVADLLDTLAANGIDRPQIRLWTAHYNGHHICNPGCYPGMPTTADGTQWATYPKYDANLLSESFIFTAPPPPVPPAPPPPAPVPPAPSPPPVLEVPDMLYWYAESDSTDGTVKTNTQWVVDGGVRWQVINAAAVAAKLGTPEGVSGNQVTMVPSV